MKKMIIPLLAVIIGVSLSAFKSLEGKQAHRSDTTYVYMGDNTLSQQRDAQWYVKPANVPSCSGAEQKICLIVTATDEGDHPDFSNGNPVDDPELFLEVSKRPFD